MLIQRFRCYSFVLALLVVVSVPFRALSSEEPACGVQIPSLLPMPSERGDPLPFTSQDLVWRGEAEIGPDASATPAHLTYSFPDDGTHWGLRDEIEPFNDLNFHLTQLFGSRNLDLGREYIRQAIAAWAFPLGITYSEVEDDGSPMDETSERVPSRGDIRIGGLVNALSVIGYNGFPVPSGNDEGGGDMVIATSFLRKGELLAEPFDSFRMLRFLVAHEHGHGLGFLHVAPCTEPHTMKQIVGLPGEVPIGVDERRGGARNYGDRLAPNHTMATATKLDAIPGIPQLATQALWRDLVVRGLALNGANDPFGTSDDWLQFRLPFRRRVRIIVTPMGGSYQAGDAGENCKLSCIPTGFRGGGPDCVRDADRAGNLALELHSSEGLLASADSGAVGEPEVIEKTLERDNYWIRIHDSGPNPADNLTVQLYDLEVRTEGAPAIPVAVAGIDKRVAIGRKCFFIADLHSHAVEHGVTIERYDWDLDGDGQFEVLDKPRPVRTYWSVGARSVRLRVRDSNGRFGLDTIQVDVHY